MIIEEANDFQLLMDNIGKLPFEILSYKVLNRIIANGRGLLHFEVAPPTDDDIDVLASVLLQGHLGCYFTPCFFYATMKLLFPSFKLEDRVKRTLKKSRTHSDIKWQAIPTANNVFRVCQDFHAILFGKPPDCVRCNENEHFMQLKRFWSLLKKGKTRNEKEILDIFLLKLSAFQDVESRRFKSGVEKLLMLSRWFKENGMKKSSKFYNALSRRYQALGSDSSFEARQHYLKESLILKELGLRTESSRALADYFGLLAEVEPSSYRCAIYEFFAYALRRKEVFGCSAYLRDLFEYHKHMMCHHTMLDESRLAFEHANKAEKIAEDFEMEPELEVIRRFSSVLRKIIEGKLPRKKKTNARAFQELDARLHKRVMDKKFRQEVNDVLLYYRALRSSDFREKARVFRKISNSLISQGEAEVANYYSFLTEVYDSIPISKTYRRSDLLRLKRIAAKYRFENLVGAEIHKELIGILLQLIEKSGSISISDLAVVKRKLDEINKQSKSLFNDEIMSGVVEITSSIVSELERYSSLSPLDSIKIADIAFRLIRIYEERIPGTLRYMEYPELVELLSESISALNRLLSDLTSPVASQKIQGKVNYLKGLWSEREVSFAIINGLWRKMPILGKYDIAKARLRDREGSREKDLILNLRLKEEKAVAIFTIKDHKRPCGIGLVDEFKTIIDEERSLHGKRVYGFFIARAFSKKATERCIKYGIRYYTISEILTLSKSSGS